MNQSKLKVIGLFRSLSCLCFKTSLSAKTFHTKMSSACSFIFMQIKVIFIRLVSHLDSLWNRDTRELGNGLLHVTEKKRGKTYASESGLILVLLLIGWKIGPSFLSQSCGEQSAKPITFSTLQWKPLYNKKAIKARENVIDMRITT